MTESVPLTVVPDSDDENVQIDVQDLLAVHSKVAAEQIAGLINRVAGLEATVAVLRQQLAKRKG